MRRVLGGGAVLPWPASFRVDSADREVGAPARTLVFGDEALVPTAARSLTRPPAGTLSLDVSPAPGEPWRGLFTAQPVAGVLADTIVGWPDGHSLLVVHHGIATLVPVHVPEQARQLDACSPIVHLLIVRDRAMIVLGSSTALAGYAATGLAWATGRLCWDELEVLGVEDGAVLCRGAGAPPHHATHELRVDLETGRYASHAYP